MDNDGILYVWLRIGDAGEYDQFDALHDVLGFLYHWNIGQELRWVRGGFQTELHAGWDYISLYWGDAAANLVRSLSEEEREEVENSILGSRRAKFRQHKEDNMRLFGDPRTPFAGIFEEVFPGLARGYTRERAIGRIWRDGKGVNIEIDIPGVKKEDVQLTVEDDEENRSLFISWKRIGAGDEDPVTEVYRRMYPVDGDADVERISAKLLDGVLAIVIPHKDEEVQKPIRREIALD